LPLNGIEVIPAKAGIQETKKPRSARVFSWRCARLTI